MRSFLIMGIFLLSPVIASATQGPQDAQKSVGDSCSALSINLLQNLQKGDFAATTAHFDKTMKTLLAPQKIKRAWQQQLPEIFGAFKSAETPQEIHKAGYNIVITPLRFAKGWGKMIVACNIQNQIAGWRILPAKAPNTATSQAPAGATAWIAEAAVGAKTLPITVQRKGFTLRGVLDLPAGKGPFPVVDLIPGSGPVNINGNVGAIRYSPYKKLAAALVAAGWAVARVAKRGLPPSTGDGNDVVFADQVADNLAVVEALRKNPHVNPKRTVVAGHSLGGLIAPKLATETKLAGLILLEAPGENMARIVTTQVLRQQKLTGASAKKLATIKAQTIKLNSLVAKAPPGQTVAYGAGSSFLARIFASSPSAVQLFKSWYAQEPLETARKINIPALVVQGGKDTQVFPDNGKRLAKALSHGKLLYLPNMDHDLSLAQEGVGKNVKLAPGLAAGIVRWLRKLKP